MKQTQAKRQERWDIARENRPTFRCKNCGEITRDGHFAPPSLGEEGFWLCKEIKQLRENSVGIKTINFVKKDRTIYFELKVKDK
jgi:hypothetical protein